VRLSTRGSLAVVVSFIAFVAVVATYWISYQRISAGERAEALVSLDRAAYQVLSLIAPFLHGEARALLDRLSQDYL